MSRGRAIFASVLVALGAIAYGASPIDILPELILGPLGLVDDAAVFIGAGLAIWKLLTGRDVTPPTPPAGPAAPPPAAETPRWEQKSTE